MKKNYFLIFLLAVTVFMACKKSHPNTIPQGIEGGWQLFSYTGGISVETVIVNYTEILTIKNGTYKRVKNGVLQDSLTYRLIKVDSNFIMQPEWVLELSNQEILGAKQSHDSLILWEKNVSDGYFWFYRRLKSID
ncbi:hypothetical protein CLV51_1011368 [Chitinophaga niastensis]|uniref:Lipocalin-like protein n=1 Tax=Chitinophaga niastensis TaxID=536980 RepID=A0A2P8HV19_CHINA|nr:hypothetical protein [Chitinophaga niastensis]PSL50025.1 hypothetical protein CLV51_1011368 [Chitinophaga niastensis]